MKKFVCLLLTCFIFLAGSPKVEATTVESSESSSELSFTAEQSTAIESTTQESDKTATTEKEGIQLHFSMLFGESWTTSIDEQQPLLGIKASLSDQHLQTIPNGITYALETTDGKQLKATNGETLHFKEHTLKNISFTLSNELAENYTIKYRVYSDEEQWSEWKNDGQLAEKSDQATHIKTIDALLEKKQENQTQTSTSETEETPVEPERVPSVFYESHIKDLGWQAPVKDGAISGTTGKKLRLEGIKITLEPSELSGGISYRTHVKDIGWQNYVTDGVMAGTTGKKLQIEAIQMKLTGEYAEKFDVYYQAHSAQFGWLDWAKNDQIAGTTGFSFDMQAIRIKLVPKDGTAPGATDHPVMVAPKLSYQTHVQKIGWQNYVKNGTTSGTTGQNLSIEALRVKLEQPALSGGVSYRAHVKDIGWQSYVNNGLTAGTTGKKLQVEAVQLKLTGEYAEKFDIYYQVHAANFGWLDWAKNDQIAGTTGFSFGIQAIRIKLVVKGQAAPGAVKKPAIKTPKLMTQAHVGGIGWQPADTSGKIVGTTGKKRQLEALKFSIPNSDLSGSIQYNSHIKNIGWQGFVANGALSGTTGRNLQIEAVQLRLTGDLKKYYDIYYRAHVQSFGWLGWTKNGEKAGTSAYGYRMEALEVKLIQKGKYTPPLSKSYQQNDYADKLKKVQHLLNTKYNSSSLGIYVMPANGTGSASINPNTEFVAASTGKLPGIYYTQKKLNSGAMKLSQPLLYTPQVNSFSGAYSPAGAGIMPKYADYQFYTVQTVLRNTIKYSDNVGANFLGYYSANQYDKPFLNEINALTGRNWTSWTLRASAKQNAQLIQAIYKLGGVANQYLQDTVYDDQRIPKYLPVKVGHKIGDVDDYRHDVAIVYAKKPYILSVMTKNYVSYETISILSKDIYDIMK
ncbi:MULTISPECIES: serine hydrolase [unclassified Enterococcus]|uniref:serine hydrolase n=1 Tax=unclassified Enterococcus TaxID=2608891 RepID=UPI001CE107A6|nr:MULTISPECIES: serine hydrolase [unclassified Enterococcus]MCA5013168.1 serine hydrolase [Enterococcus sp. S23]MCA5016418.1 serine hydrolase [Enterococcus sp. S22(2020)]